MKVETAAPRPPGRPRDAEREQALLNAAIGVLGERGYGALTIDEVVTRAGSSKATVYRRWMSKEELVVDALTRLADEAVTLPDTGSLVGDLRALLYGMVNGLSGRGGRLLRAVVGELGRSAALTAAFQERHMASRRKVLDVIVERAARRGEVPVGLDARLLAEVGPAVLVYRLLMTDEPVDMRLAERIVDGVLVPLIEHGGNLTASDDLTRASTSSLTRRPNG